MPALRKVVCDDAIPASTCRTKKTPLPGLKLNSGEDLIYGRMRWYARWKLRGTEQLVYKVVIPNAFKALYDEVRYHVIGACAASETQLAWGGRGARKQYTKRHTVRVLAQLREHGIIAPLGWEGWGRVRYLVLSEPMPRELRERWAAVWASFEAQHSPHLPRVLQGGAARACSEPAPQTAPLDVAALPWLPEDCYELEDSDAQASAGAGVPSVPFLSFTDERKCHSPDDILTPLKLLDGSLQDLERRSKTHTETPERPGQGGDPPPLCLLDAHRRRESRWLADFQRKHPEIPRRVFDEHREPERPYLDYCRLLWMRLTVEGLIERDRISPTKYWPGLVRKSLAENYLGWYVDEHPDEWPALVWARADTYFADLRRLESVAAANDNGIESPGESSPDGSPPLPSPPEWLALVERLPIPDFCRECFVKPLTARFDGVQLLLTTPHKFAVEWLSNRQSMGGMSLVEHINSIEPDWIVRLCINAAD